MSKTNEPITWEPKKVKLSDLNENPNNPKIITDIGRKRLTKSIEQFGPAGTIIVNADMSIIDGHSRKKELQENNVEEVWVSVPSRQLTQKEYEQFNALIDLARAGEPDMLIIEEVIGEEMMDEFDLKKSGKAEIKEIELKPFVQTHVLLSFPPEKMIDLQPLLQKIAEFPYVEYEQSSN